MPEGLWEVEPDLSGLDPFTALVYSESGAGKSTVPITLPAPVLFLCTERGAIKFLWALGYRPLFRRVRSHADAIQAIRDLREQTEGALAAGEKPPVRSVVFDSITQYEDRTIVEIVRRGGALVKSSQPETLSEAGFGALGSWHLQCRMAFQDVPYVHKVMIALPRNYDDPIRGVKMIAPAASGQQGQRYPASCDFVFYLTSSIEAGRELRRFRTRNQGRYLGKARSTPLPEEMSANFMDVMARTGYLSGDEQFHLPGPPGTLGTREQAEAAWRQVCETGDAPKPANGTPPAAGAGVGVGAEPAAGEDDDGMSPRRRP